MKCVILSPCCHSWIRG